MRLRDYQMFSPCNERNGSMLDCSEMQDFFNPIILRHQNTKTRWYKISKNHWVMALFEMFRSAREKLQFTVALDHPVLTSGNLKDCV